MEVNKTSLDHAGTSLEGYLSSRDAEILRSINEDGESVVAFQGLKRKLGMHQETLARSLARLQREGFIEKSAEGYRVSRKAGLTHTFAQPGVLIPVIRSYLPFSIDLQNFANELKGTWFGKLRWLGHSSHDSENILTWITDDGSIQVELKIDRLSIAVQARVKESADVREAVIEAHELYARVSETYTKQLRKSGLLVLDAQVS
jgi:DNA-binding Lrp family transcriptional regulator